MKKILSLLAVALLMPIAAQAEVKMALIDLQEVFKGYYKTEEADARLKEQMAGYKKERDDRMEDYRKLVEQIKGLDEAAKDPSLSDAARKEKQQALQDKVGEARQREQEIREFEQTTQKLFQDQSGRMRKTIVDEIQKAVQDFSKGKYNMVLDKSGVTLNTTSMIVYSEGVTDITQEIITSLNKSKPAAGSSDKPAEKK